jgi:predicted TIM-barrel fold metal-dependent hydrolase
MAGAMLPSNGEGIKGHFGSKIYWPIYQECEKLDAPLGVHVGALHHLGMDSLGVYYAVHGLGHPFGIMTQAAAMLAYGVFDRFPKLRVGFLEGGATWVPFFMDRLDRSYPHHLQVDINGEFLPSSKPDVMASDYFRRHVREGRIFVGFDCDDRGLGFAVKEAGNGAFLFATDFPHESFDAKHCRHEIEDLLARDDINQKDKSAILATNAKRFYGVEQ